MIESWDGVKPFANIYTDEPEAAAYLQNHRNVRLIATYYRNFLCPGQEEVGWQFEIPKRKLNSILAHIPGHINQQLTGGHSAKFARRRTIFRETTISVPPRQKDAHRAKSYSYQKLPKGPSPT